MITNPLNELKRSLELSNKKEGMSQYILMTYAEDILVSPDIMVLTLLNSKYHMLGVMDHNDALREAQIALEGSLSPDVVSVEVCDGMVRFRPKIVNEYEDTMSFVLMSKIRSKFILRDIFNKYFGNKDVSSLIVDIYLNKNCSNVLSSDSNYICYDDSIPFMKEVLTVFINGTHNKRLVPLSKLCEFVINMATERETVFDFITSDINDVMITLHKDITEIISKNDIKDEVVENIKICSLIGNITMLNVKTMNELTPPGYNIGLLNLFKSNLVNK